MCNTSSVTNVIFPWSQKGIKSHILNLQFSFLLRLTSQYNKCIKRLLARRGFKSQCTLWFMLHHMWARRSSTYSGAHCLAFISFQSTMQVPLCVSKREEPPSLDNSRSSIYGYEGYLIEALQLLELQLQYFTQQNSNVLQIMPIKQIKQSLTQIKIDA